VSASEIAVTRTRAARVMSQLTNIAGPGNLLPIEHLVE
jgi:hypothetical protein